MTREEIIALTRDVAAKVLIEPCLVEGAKVQTGMDIGAECARRGFAAGVEAMTHALIEAGTPGGLLRMAAHPRFLEALVQIGQDLIAAAAKP